MPNYDGDDMQDEWDPYYAADGGGDPSDPYGLNTLPGGGQGLNPIYGNSGAAPYFNAPNASFSVTGTGQMPTSFPNASSSMFAPWSGGGGDIYGLLPNPGGGGSVSDPTSPNPTPGGSTTNNNTQNNTQNNASQLNVASESTSNALPPISSGSPEGNPSQFDPQYIPQSQRRMNPSGMDSGRHMPSSLPASQPPMDYDPGLSKSGTGVPLGDGKTMPTTPSQSASLGSTLKEAALGLTGVNRYRKMLQDVRKRPRPTPFNSPYGI